MPTPIDEQPRDSVIDPRSVFQKSGEDVLRKRLNELDRNVLEQVIRTYSVHHTPPPAMADMSGDELVEFVMDSVRREEGTAGA